MKEINTSAASNSASPLGHLATLQHLSEGPVQALGELVRSLIEPNFTGIVALDFNVGGGGARTSPGWGYYDGRVYRVEQDQNSTDANAARWYIKTVWRTGDPVLFTNGQRYNMHAERVLVLSDTQQTEQDVNDNTVNSQQLPLSAADVVDIDRISRFSRVFETWQSLTMLNGASSPTANPAQARISGQQVQLRGRLTCNINDSNVDAQLPSDVVIAREVVMIVPALLGANSVGAAIMRINATSNGNTYLTLQIANHASTSGVGIEVYLDGIVLPQG